MALETCILNRAGHNAPLNTIYSLNIHVNNKIAVLNGLIIKTTDCKEFQLMEHRFHKKRKAEFLIHYSEQWFSTGQPQHPTEGWY
jgi:hypothetical protein